MKRRSLLRLTGAAALNLALSAAARAEHAECEVPPELSEVSVKLSHLAERLAARQPVNIVAIGGASTKGAAAGAPDLAYPHRLQVALAGYYPDIPIAVVNKGVPRQSTQQMVERFPTDVIAEDPILPRGGCRVTSENSTIDAQVEQRLGAAIAAVLGDERSAAANEAVR